MMSGPTVASTSQENVAANTPQGASSTFNAHALEFRPTGEPHTLSSTGTVPKTNSFTPSISIGAASMLNSPYAPCVVLAVRNPQTQAVNFLVALLDNGCTGLVISEEAAERLGSKTWSEMVTIKVLEETTHALRKNVEVDLISLDDVNTQFLSQRAIVASSIPVHPQAIPYPADLAKYPFMHDVKIATPPRRQVDMIIGVNLSFTWAMPKEFRRGPPDLPFAVKSVWGWFVQGGENVMQTLMTSYLTQIDNRFLSAKLDQIFNEDFRSLPGDQDVEKLSREEIKTLDFLNNSISLQEGHYHVPAPWRQSKVETCRVMDSIDSRQTARKRFDGLCRKMTRDPVIKEKIFAKMETLESRGYVERVPQEELNNKGKWYLPLHPATHPRKPDKVRLTHDASAKTSGRCLNDFLFKGPDNACKLVSVILKARMHAIFLKCDIQDFFMRVKMAIEDKDAFRFFFWADQTESEIIEWRTLVWLFGILSSPCIATLALRRCALDNAADFGLEVRDTIEESTYVDDCFRSVPDVKTALILLKELQRILKRGGFKLANS